MQIKGGGESYEPGRSGEVIKKVQGPYRLSKGTHRKS